MDPAVSAHNITNTPNFQIVCRFFKCFLHLPRPKPPKITTIAVG